MDCRPSDISKKDPNETFMVSCPYCGKHDFKVFVGSIQLSGACRLKCPECTSFVRIYINSNNELIIDSSGYDS